MSTPQNPFDDQSRDEPGHPENSGRPQYPSYPSTPHPEDTPNFGAGYGTGTGYGAGYAGYGYEQSAYGQPSGGQPGFGQPQGTGKIQPMEAVSWAFGTVFRNWLLWIVGTVALVVVLVGVSVSIEAAFGTQVGLGYQIAQLGLTLLTAAVGVLIYHGALRQVDKPKVSLGDFTDNVNFGPALALSILLQLVVSIVFIIIAVPFFLAGNPIGETQMASTDEAMAFLGTLFAALALIMVLALLLAPLTTFMVWYLIDRRATFGGAIAEGFRAGVRNYGRLLAFNLVAGVVVGLSALITFGLALLVLLPVMVLAQAMMFRQAAAGPLPAPAQR